MVLSMTKHDVGSTSIPKSLATTVKVGQDEVYDDSSLNSVY